MEENLRIFLHCLFTDGVVAENSIYSATICESAALWAELSACFQRTEPSQAHIRSAAPPKGELFCSNGTVSKYSASLADLTERASVFLIVQQKELPCKRTAALRKVL